MNSTIIIGGADGPTAIFVTGNPSLLKIGIVVALAIIIGVVFIIKRKK